MSKYWNVGASLLAFGEAFGWIYYFTAKNSSKKGAIGDTYIDDFLVNVMATTTEMQPKGLAVLLVAGILKRSEEVKSVKETMYKFVDDKCH
jgi:hypothetical protein